MTACNVKSLLFVKRALEFPYTFFIYYYYFFSDFAADGLIIDSRVEAFALGFALTSEKII